MSILREAAQAVIDNWEKGDLAGAVCNLGGVLSQLQPASTEQVERARETYAEDGAFGIEIDDETFVAEAPNGVWVQAWVFLPNENADDCAVCGEDGGTSCGVPTCGLLDQRCNLGMGCDEVGTCYAQAIGLPGKCGKP